MWTHCNVSNISCGSTYVVAISVVSVTSAPVSVSVSISVSISTYTYASASTPDAAAPSNAAYATASFTFLSYPNHCLRCSALITEGPTERLCLRLCTSHSILSSIGTEYSNGKGLTDMGIFYPGGGMQ